MGLLSGTLLRLSSVKAGMMDENGKTRRERETKEEEGETCQEGLNGYMVLLPRVNQRGVPLPLSHAQGIYRNLH